MSIQEMMEAKLKDDETINDVVRMLNKNIDVPFVNEKTEAKHIRAAVNGVIDILLKVLFK
jgi:hypothetical protein|tara:strand:- start:280 stop:459 length:180 start_codon:yes stop_codon:yes gene_type:complete